MIELQDSGWIGNYLRADGSEPIYYVTIEKSEGLVDPDGGIEFWPGSGSGYVYRFFATGPVTWDEAELLRGHGVLDESRLNGESISEVVYQVSASRVPGGTASVPGFRFNLDNSNGFYKQLEADGVRFEGRKVELFLTFDGETDRGNDVQLFSGFISDLNLKKNYIEIRAEGVESRRDSEMPPNIFEEEVNEWETLVPARTIGKTIPLVFGSHDMAQGRLVTEVKDNGTQDKGRAYRFIDTSIALGVKDITNFRFGDEGLVDATGGFASIKTVGVNSFPDTTLFSLDVPNGEAYFDEISPEKVYLFADVRPKAAVHHGYYRDAENPENALDHDEATFSHLESYSWGSRHYGTYKIPAMSLSGEIEKNGFDLGIFCLMRIRWAMDAGSEGWAQVFIGEIDQSGGTNLSSNKPGKNIGYQINGTWDWLSPPNPIDEIQLQAEGSVVWEDWNTLSKLGKFFFHHCLYKPGTPYDYYTLEYDLYEFVVRVYFTIDFPDDGFFAEVEGYKDDAWGTNTGTVNSLIENPAHLVSAILAIFGESAVVDNTQHQAVAYHDRNNWKFARNITDRGSMESIIKELCESALLFSWTNEEGKAQVFPVSAPSGSADFRLSAEDVSQGILEQPSRTPMSEVVTDFTIQYKYNPLRDEFDEQILCNPSNSSTELGLEFESICGWAKYNNGGIEKKKTIELDWVRDRATAIEIAKKLIRWYSSRRWELNWTSDLALVQVQLGDSFTLAPGWLEDQPDSLTSGVFRVVQKKLDPRKDIIRFSAVQVFE